MYCKPLYNAVQKQILHFNKETTFLSKYFFVYIVVQLYPNVIKRSFPGL